MAKIRVGIIGSGSICRKRHALEYASNSDAEIVAFADVVRERAEECAEKFGGTAYQDWQELLAKEELDAISVCTPNYLHAPISIAALRAKKHVLCEKPMATTDEESQAMIQAAREAGKFLMIGHNQRLARMHVRGKEIIDSGLLGKIISFRTSFAHGGPETWSIERKEGWFFNREHAIFGAMGDLGVHKADLIRFLLGEEVTEVSAFVEQNAKPYGNVDDNAVCILKMQSGAIGTLTASWSHVVGEDNSTIIYGTKGILRMGANDSFPVVVNLAGGETQNIVLPKMQSNEAGGQTGTGVIRTFVESIKTGTPPAISGEEGRLSVNVILACMESARTGQRVQVQH